MMCASDHGLFIPRATHVGVLDNIYTVVCTGCARAMEVSGFGVFRLRKQAAPPPEDDGPWGDAL